MFNFVNNEIIIEDEAINYLIANADGEVVFEKVNGTTTYDVLVRKYVKGEDKDPAIKFSSFRFASSTLFSIVIPPIVVLVEVDESLTLLSITI